MKLETVIATILAAIVPSVAGSEGSTTPTADSHCQFKYPNIAGIMIKNICAINSHPNELAFLCFSGL